MNHRLLFVGETWSGSSARSLLEAMRRRSTFDIEEVEEDHFKVHGQSIAIRLLNRLTTPLRRREFVAYATRKLNATRPHVCVVYKGNMVAPDFILKLKAAGVVCVNVWPDVSPAIFGNSLRTAVGLYDCVITTKEFHPPIWRSVYKYGNTCVYVPHGYDPILHRAQDVADEGEKQCDVAMAATWRPQYGALIEQLAALLSRTVSVRIAGAGWSARAKNLPSNFMCVGPQTGRSYREFLRQARIVIAPLHQDVRVDGRVLPGDQDTTRTYELPASGAFFVHQRSERLTQLFSERDEVPMWGNASELAKVIVDWLPLSDLRHQMAARLWTRAPSEFSIDARVPMIEKAILRTMGAI